MGAWLSHFLFVLDFLAVVGGIQKLKHIMLSLGVFVKNQKRRGWFMSSNRSATPCLCELHLEQTVQDVATDTQQQEIGLSVSSPTTCQLEEGSGAWHDGLRSRQLESYCEYVS